MLKRISLTALVLLTAVFSQAAETEKYVEGQHYIVLDKPLKTSYRGEEIGEIMEFFSYACIHCYNLEPGIARYLEQKPDNIRFTKVPVMFNGRQEAEVRAYYTVNTLRLGEEAHAAIYNEIHQKRNRLGTDSQFAKVLEPFGVTEEKYLATAYSFGVEPRVKAAAILTGQSQIKGTPGIVVNGKYLIESGAVGGNEAALYAAQWLVERDAASAQ